MEYKKVFLVRNEEIVEPAMIWDKKTGTVLKVGEKETLRPTYETMMSVYNNVYKMTNWEVYKDLSENTELVSLPKDQDIIDKVFNITDYAKIHIKEWNL